MADEYNVRAGRGQAFNLAVADAIASFEPKHRKCATYKKYILEQYQMYHQLAQIVQENSPQDLATFMEDL